MIIRARRTKKRCAASWLLLLAISIHIALGFHSCRLIKKEPDKFPEARISNGLIDAKFYLPDTVNGYYRGSRFDWAGVMPELQYDNHSYFGQWYDEYDPYIHDAIMGPVNDFYPLGYDEGNPGDRFVKIGIGAFIKRENERYSFRKPAELINSGNWFVHKEKDQIKFTHQFNEAGYAYDYTKIVRLEDRTPVMSIVCSIVNNGQDTIDTRVYNHNFFVFDKQATGPDFSIEFPFSLSGKFVRGSDKAEFQNNKIVFIQKLTHGQTTLADLEGFSDSPGDYDIKIENRETGAGVRITCDKPIARLVFWASHAVVCVEPYTQIKINPAEQFTWTITYQFYTMKQNVF